MSKHLTGIESHYIIKNNKKMQFGYTTGTCATAASKAAAFMLLSGDLVNLVKVSTPKGIDLQLETKDVLQRHNFVSCGIQKDAGDDPDATDGITIYARVEKISSGFYIDGDIGVGRVTKPGLEQPVGAAAINRVPREMITEALKEVALSFGYKGGLKATISAPEGVEIAKKTFNPRLGIEGGISILGTSGIVEPMSEIALIKSIEIEMKQQIALGRRNLIITLGNYGKGFLDKLETLPLKESVKCSNYIGEAIDMAVAMGAESILFISHIGKFIKVAGGIMNTHSRNADCRAEIMAACALRAGMSNEAALAILTTLTTDEALDIVKKENLLQETIDQITEKISFYLNHRCYGAIRTEALIFSNAYGYLGETKGCSELIEIIKEEING